MAGSGSVKLTAESGMSRQAPLSDTTASEVGSADHRYRWLASAASMRPAAKPSCSDGAHAHDVTKSPRRFHCSVSVCGPAPSGTTKDACSERAAASSEEEGGACDADARKGMPSTSTRACRKSFWPSDMVVSMMKSMVEDSGLKARAASV